MELFNILNLSSLAPVTRPALSIEDLGFSHAEELAQFQPINPFPGDTQLNVAIRQVQTVTLDSPNLLEPLNTTEVSPNLAIDLNFELLDPAPEITIDESPLEPPVFERTNADPPALDLRNTGAVRLTGVDEVEPSDPLFSRPSRIFRGFWSETKASNLAIFRRNRWCFRWNARIAWYLI